MADEREEVRKHLIARKAFNTHLAVYAVVNAFLILIWGVTGGGYFWPMWPLAGWGIGLAIHAWTTFGHLGVTDADIDAELERRRRAAGAA